MSDRATRFIGLPKYPGLDEMTLLDYFAACAISAPWGEAVTPEVHPNGVVTAEAVAALAANCYALAEAMLKQRATMLKADSHE